MSQTLRKISEKKLIKEVETNFKLVGILLGIAGPWRPCPGTPGSEPLPPGLGIFHFNGKSWDLSSKLNTLLWQFSIIASSHAGAGLGRHSNIIIQF